MRTLRSLCIRFRGLFRRSRRDAELEAEIESHLAMQIDDNVRAGMTPDEARRAALMKLGGVEQVKESYRAQRTIPWLDSLLRDIRFGMRMLGKNPTFAAVAILTLGFGIGLNASMFTVANALVFRAPDGISDPQHLVTLRATDRSQSFALHNISVPLYELFAQNTHLTDLAAEGPTGSVRLGSDPAAPNIRIAYVSHNYFQVLGSPLLLGRPFSMEEESAPRSGVVILGFNTWQRDFAGNAATVGSFALIGDKEYEIIGVTPKGFNGTDDRAVDAFLLLNEFQSPIPNSTPSASVLGRVHKGVPLRQAQIEANSAFYNSGGASDSVITMRPYFEGLSGNLSGGQKLSLWLAGVSFLVLLIAGVNVANVSLARMAQRGHEMAVRLQLGASRSRLMAQVFIESALLCAIGIPVALLLDFAAQPLIRAYLLPVGFDTGSFFNWRLLATMAALAALATMVSGIAPAWSVSRAQLVETLKSHGPGYTLSRTGLRNALLAGQMALTLFLCVGAGLLLRSLQKVLAIDKGYEPDHMLVATIDRNMNGYIATDSNAAYQKLLQRAQAIPGIEHAGLWSNGWDKAMFMNIHVGSHWVDAGLNWVSADYFSAMGMKLIGGRLLTDADVAESQPVAVVTAEFMADERAAGISKDECLPIKIFSMDACYQIVGVVKGTLPMTLIPITLPPSTHMKMSNMISSVYIPLSPAAQQANAKITYCLVMRTRGNPGEMMKTVVAALRSAAPNTGSITVKYVSSYADQQTLRYRSQAALFGLFAVVALALASVGIYGVLAFLVRQRTAEIGVRMVVGAQRWNILRMVLLQGMKIAGIGLFIGVAASWAATRLMTSLLYGIAPNDPVTFAAVIAIFVTVALLACWIPAHRATRVDPMIALRCE